MNNDLIEPQAMPPTKYYKVGILFNRKVGKCKHKEIKIINVSKQD